MTTTLQHYKMIIVMTLLQKPTCVAANHPSHWRTVVSWWSRAVQVSETVPWPTAPPTYRHMQWDHPITINSHDHSTDRRQIPIDRWTGFNDILSMHVTAISCLKEFINCLLVRPMACIKEIMHLRQMLWKRSPKFLYSISKSIQLIWCSSSRPGQS